MSAHNKSDLNLSLTGSQLSVLSARSRQSQSGSNAKQSQRANSMVDIRQKKVKNETEYKAEDYTRHRRGSFKATDEKSIASMSSVHSSKSVTSVILKPNESEDEFLALFESTSTSSKSQRKPAASDNYSFGRKTPTKASDGLKGKRTVNKPAWASKPSSGNTTARSDEPHNIFRPHSVRSDEDDEVIGDISHSLSQSINKLQSLQNQLSASSNHMDNVNGNNLSHDTTSSVSTLTPEATPRLSHQSSSIDDFIQSILDRTPRSDNNHDSARLLSNNPAAADSCRTNEQGASILANNVSRLGQQPKIKASLSSIENSYQNIKHKTPVNQVNSGGSFFKKSGLHTLSAPMNSSLPLKQTYPSSSPITVSAAGKVEDYLSKLNLAASKIQKWYSRHRTRRAAAEAALKRLLGQKKQEQELKLQKETANSLMFSEGEGRKGVDKKKAKEEKAKEARQQAILEMKKKREEHKNEIKKIAVEEIHFLQANGKISKRPMSSKKKKLPTTEINESNNVTQRDEEVQSVHEPEQKESSSNAVDTDKVTEANSNTRTTLEDLYSTLKKLEEEENFLTARTENKASWLNDFDKDEGKELDSHLTAENLERLNSQKDDLTKSGFLSDDKLKSIISFLDEVQVTDKLSEIDMEICRINEDLEKPVLLVPSAFDIAQIEQAQATASEVTTTVLTQRLELEEKKRTVSMLQKALNQQRELTVRHAKETEKEMKKRLDVQKEEYEEAIKRHLSFIDQLIDDKKNLSEKCEKLVTELKSVDKKYQDKMKTLETNHTIELTKLKEVQAAAEKLRREKWIEDKTKKIKEMTVKGLEPEIQRLIAKHKSDIKKIQQIHEAELLESDERAAQRYVKMTEELRDQLAAEKEAAIAREREASKLRYEKQLQHEEEAYQQKQRRLYQEVQEEKDRLASSASRQRAELEKLQRQLEDSHRIALETIKEEFDKSREEQEKRHKSEIKMLQEKLKLEKESWEENYMKKHETWLVQKERELRDQIKKERDKEIELVIERLEEDASTTREENERTTEQKIRRLREKFEVETRELEQSERKAVQRYNEIKAKMTEVEGENERLKVIIRQKEQEILDTKKLLEKMNSERSHVSDIIRQEFADRIVATDEENKRIKHEISELRARHRIDLEKAQRDYEELQRSKDQELEEVHKRVKQAIVKKEEVVAQLKQQYQAANKRADHLEGLLEQQRKQLLNHK
ncbi:centrosomal protein of 131 kDa [Biomphalaria glabrata]|nr:centrosomal protein of 131 kDa [Biomphalaria glabrata]